MRLIANLYLLAYFADAIISVLDEILKHVFGIEGLSFLRSSVASVVFFSSLIVLVILGIDSRLPKKLFLPLILFLAWCSFYPEPFMSLLGVETANTTLSVLQLLISISGFIYLRILTEGKLYLTNSFLSGPIFKWKNTLMYFSANAVLMPFIIVFGGFQLLKSGVNEFSSEFVRLDSTGLYLVDKEYEKDGALLRLIGMIHIGDINYYLDISQSMKAENTLILTEGVSDEQKRISISPSYNKLANYLGLVPQDYVFPNITTSQSDNQNDNIFDNNELIDFVNISSPTIIRADIDTSEFTDDTIDYINSMGSIIENGDSFLRSSLEMYKWTEDNFPPDIEATVMKDILEKRNNVLLTHLDEQLGEYENILIPWGAMHLPQIEVAVLERGFTLQSTKERRAINFQNIAWLELIFSEE
jgi:hypothetical protein